MGILDDLREETVRRKEHDKEERSKRQTLEDVYRQEILPQMQRIYAYLDELTGHLNYIKPQITVSCYDAEVRGLGDLQQLDYKVGTDGRGGIGKLDELVDVALSFSCLGEGEVKYDLEGGDRIERECHQLHTQGMKFDVVRHANADGANPRGSFVAQRKVPIQVRFTVDNEAARIVLAILNFDGLETRRFTLQPAQIDDAFLDDFGKYILRKDNRFMVFDLSEEHRQEIRRKLMEDRQAREREAGASAGTERGGSKSAPLIGLFRKRRS